MIRFISLLLVLFVCLPSASATTTLLLKDGGILEGELLNPNEISRKLYQIKTAEGLEISLDAKLVDRTQVREREDLIEYNKDAPLTNNTVENHISWAKWCNEHQLPEQARVHWRQVMELDPEHIDARRILGYILTPTGWVLQRDSLESKGLIQNSRGEWKTAQAIEVAKMLEDRKQEADYWKKKIQTLCQKLPQTEDELLAIRDPAAVIPIRDILLKENNPQKRAMLLRTLVNIPDSLAIQSVANWSIRPNEVEDIRKMCVEELQRRMTTQSDIRHIMVAVYREALRSKTVDKMVIDLAATVLADIGGHEALPELIDALVVERKVTLQSQPQTYGFGSGGSGYSQPGKPAQISVRDENQTVLTALNKLTGFNFGFNQARWREWYRQSLRSPAIIDLRRS